ncbi:MAG: hypothetical protein JKX84_06530, partial [Flavobacteriales bacterium]|nr:hypothetical protein [Flavobacteriales bacterium]
MKNLTLSLLVIFTFLFLSEHSFAQTAPQKMNYQGIARNVSGEIISDQTISLRIAILSSANMERPVYAEQHEIITNKLGLFTLHVGGGRILEGEMKSINWGAADHYISVELDADNSGRFVEMGVSQLLSVPYAFYSERSGTTDDGSRTLGSEAWVTHGNAGTDANDFVGTTDAQDLIFKTNGTEVGRFNQTGQLALPTSNDITIGGVNALNMDGTRNIHIGQNAGVVSTGDQNAFIGYNTGFNNTTGSKNAFIGPTAGRLNTTGSQNAFIGGRAGFDNTTGSQNSFIGWLAGRSNS